MSRDFLEIKTAKITSKGQIAIPKEIRNLEDFREGTKIAIIAYRDHVELRSLRKMKRRFTALASEKILARDWLSKEEDEAWKDL
ncbi:MAG: AbrB/MazE/SpoVT family DNA-binding domain-containing protein [Candidatus Aenigmarchaeota archaeon]|nr:AbrB/MazE/SpoVT family DNA-binding domain-containing protein [Candidatus Aenigmarchaeota archaeon]